MFAVKSEYSIKTPDGNEIPFYVASDSIFFAVIDLNPDINTEVFPACYFRSFKNYALRFISLDNLKYVVLNYTATPFYKNEAFWVHFVCHNDTKKVIAEVRDAQDFVKTWTPINLPENWSCLNIDWIINTLPSRTSDWIKKCYKSLQILATNDEQRKDARRVYDKAWEILKAREKDDIADKRSTVRDTLAKFGLTDDDDLIQAILDVHQRKFDKEHAKRQAEFDNQHIYLENELRRILK